jgi:diguanylate cyclase (GGDEF)-like protein/PAS domain S-box-containing protein
MPSHAKQRRLAILLLLILFVAGWLAAFGYTLWRLRAEALATGHASARMHARNFEEHLTQVLQTIDLTAGGIVPSRGPALDVRELNGRLEAILRPSPFLRSLSIMDASGHIVASSNAANLGLGVAIDGYFPLARADAEVLRIDVPRRGRDFASADRSTRSPALTGSDNAFIPVVSKMPVAGTRYWLLAALNPDYFVDHFSQLLDPGVGYAQWLRYDGILLLSADPGDVPGLPSGAGEVGARLAEREQGDLTQVLGNGREVLTAYRASSRFPAVVAVHIDRRAILARWHGEARRIASIALPALLALTLAGVWIWRRQGRLEDQRAEIDRQRRLAASVFDASNDAIILTAPNGDILSVNPAFEMMNGYSAAEVIGHNPRLLASGLQDAEYYRQMWASLLQDGRWQGEIVNRRKDGSLYTALLTINAVGDDQVGLRHYVGVSADISARKRAEALDTLSKAYSHAHLGMLITDAEERILDANPALSRLSGYAREELLGATPRLLGSDAHPAEFFRAMWQAIANAGYWQGEMRNRRKDGALYDAYVTISRIDDNEGRPSHYIAFLDDISERKRADDALKLAASVFTHAREGILITTEAGDIVEVNEAFSAITGYARDEVIGRNPRLLKSGRHDAEFYALMWRALLDHGFWAGEIWNRRKDGEIYAELITISAVRDSGGMTRHYVALFSDITAQKEHQSQLEHMAHYDPLTGLPNRLLLHDRMRQALLQAKRRGQRVALAYIDLDGFKTINDRHGHQAGDQLLKGVAERMRQCLREGDTIARLGGDEFVALIVDLPQPNACLPLVQRLLAAAAQPVHSDGLILQVSASIGVSIDDPGEERDADQLLRQADQAMYQAKLAGRNRYHIFDLAQDRDARGRHESIERIRQGMLDGEFVLYYQPKVNLRNGALVGAEALVRWRHPERGLLEPMQFLPDIEAHPLSVELGDWVIATALAQIAAWRGEGLDLPVSVNVSARHLQQSDFVERLRERLAAHATLGRHRLELEVLETSALEDMDYVSSVIDACAEMGVDFALDDFGTGYSSLTYLKCLPAHVLKIDQSFVRDMLDDPDDLAILNGVLGLANAFGREAIAEGVETVAHGETLLWLGCQLAQGFGIAHPMPAELLPAWYRNWRPDPIWSLTPRLDSTRLPVLFAASEHRAWVRALDAYLGGEREDPPPLDPHRCRFGMWLDDSDKRHAEFGAERLAPIETLHVRLHELGEALVAARGGAWDAVQQARRDELHAVHGELMRLLSGLASMA